VKGRTVALNKPAAELTKKVPAAAVDKVKTRPTPAVTKKAAPPTEKKPNRIVRYFKEVRAELRKVVWPNRKTTIRLTAIVFAVTTGMSLFLGLLDLIFSKLFALIIGA
jgi:preprotein translocase subunit SecE